MANPIELTNVRDVINLKDSIYHCSLMLGQLVEATLTIGDLVSIIVPYYLVNDIFNAFGILAGDQFDGFKFEYSKDYDKEYEVYIATDFFNSHDRIHKQCEHKFGLGAKQICKNGRDYNQYLTPDDSIVFIYKKDVSAEIFKAVSDYASHNKIVIFDIID